MDEELAECSGALDWGSKGCLRLAAEAVTVQRAIGFIRCLVLVQPMQEDRKPS